MKSDQREFSTAQGVNDRRKARRRVLLSGKVVYQEGDASFDCTILDHSTHGARIRLPQGRGMPSHIFLIDIRHQTAHETTVVWLKPPLAGLRFERTYPLGGQLPEQLKYLRRLWIESAAR